MLSSWPARTTWISRTERQTRSSRPAWNPGAPRQTQRRILRPPQSKLNPQAPRNLPTFRSVKNSVLSRAGLVLRDLPGPLDFPAHPVNRETMDSQADLDPTDRPAGLDPTATSLDHPATLAHPEPLAVLASPPTALPTPLATLDLLDELAGLECPVNQKLTPCEVQVILFRFRRPGTTGKSGQRRLARTSRAARTSGTAWTARRTRTRWAEGTTRESRATRRVRTLLLHHSRPLHTSSLDPGTLHPGSLDCLDRGSLLDRGALD